MKNNWRWLEKVFLIVGIWWFALIFAVVFMEFIYPMPNRKLELYKECLAIPGATEANCGRILGDEKTSHHR